MNSATARFETVQQAIERRNRETAANRRLLFGKKASSQKIHENLYKALENNIEALQAFKNDPSNINGVNLGAALKELRSAMSLSRRNLEL